MKPSKTLALTLAAALAAAPAAAPSAFAAPDGNIIRISKEGANKDSIAFSIAPGGAIGKDFVYSLRRNLEISGCFKFTRNGAIKITSSGGRIAVSGHGQAFAANIRPGTPEEQRSQARSLANSIVKKFAGVDGFAHSRIVLVKKNGSNDAEVYTCCPDGKDLMKLTGDRRAAVGPRWHPDARRIFYTGFLRRNPLVYILDTAQSKRTLLAPFKGLATGAAVSPDGRSCAIILSFQGNPELYIYHLGSARISRLTRTGSASEASPCWSPDGSKIAFVSDTTRRPQIYVLPAGAKSADKPRRLTTRGQQNVNPSWNRKGRIAYATQRSDGWHIAVMDASSGDSSSKLVTDGGTWEHPSWAPDCRHIVAARDGILWIIDSEEEDPPTPLFRKAGNWTSPDWSAPLK